MKTIPCPRLRSKKLFRSAQQVLPGGVDSPVRAFSRVGGTPLFVSRASGADDRGRRRQPLHRLRDVVGPADPRPRAARAREGDRRRRQARHQLRRAEPARASARRAGANADAVDGARAVRQLGHRGRHERRARRPRLHRPRPHHQVRRVLSRPRRRVSRQGGIGRDDAGHPDEPGRARGRHRRHAARALQRPRLGLGALQRAGWNDRGGDRRADRRQHGARRRPPTGSCPGCATSARATASC